MDIFNSPCLICSIPKQRVHVQATLVERVVDTTGAGDAFSGSLAFFYAGLQSHAAHAESREIVFPLLVEAARRACFVAAVSVTRAGTQSSYPMRGELPAALFDFATPKVDLPARVVQ